jgi:hypothetical protein
MKTQLAVVCGLRLYCRLVQTRVSDYFFISVLKQIRCAAPEVPILEEPFEEAPQTIVTMETYYMQISWRSRDYAISCKRAIFLLIVL